MTHFTKESVLTDAFFPDMNILKTDEAYIRSEQQNGENIWGIYDSEGMKIGYATSREVAMALAIQNDLTPMTVH